MCVAGLTLATGCRAPTQVDYYDFDFQKAPDVRQLIWRSPVIVVGTVASSSIIRAGVPARRQPELLLDHVRVEVDVENVLRGEIDRGRRVIEFFTISAKNQGGWTGPAPLTIRAAERRMFFLTKDAGVYRSIGDGRNDYVLYVWSGRHEDVRRDESMAALYSVPFRRDTVVGNAIAEILLNLGEGYDGSGMTSSLSWDTHLSSVLTTRKKTAARLHVLAANDGEPRVGAKACLILAEQFYGQYACLEKFMSNAALGMDVRKEMSEVQVKRLQWNRRLKEDLRKRPLAELHLGDFSDSLIGLREELELMLDDPDKELRQLACSHLTRNYSRTTCTSER
jgi:hypothetical protein